MHMRELFILVIKPMLIQFADLSMNHENIIQTFVISSVAMKVNVG